MKNMTKRLLALLLAAGTMVSLAACSTGDGGDETKESGTGSAVTEEDTGYKPDIAKTNYNSDFVLMNYSSILDDVLFVADEASRGDPMADSVYERALNIKDHLGVTLKLTEAGTFYEYATVVRRNVQSGEDAHQLVLTHGTTGAGTLVTSNCLYDYTDFNAVDLSAPYWNQDVMEQAKIGDRYLLGYGDFSLSHVHSLIFNKDMMKEYNIKEPYALVDNQKWTLDQFISIVSTVSKDNGDGQWNELDTYGLTGWCGTYMTSFLVASGLNVVEKDPDTDIYYLAYTKHAEKLGDLTDKLIAMGNSEYAYLSGIGTNTDIDFTNGTSLFQFYDAADLAILRSSSVRFGVLPFPKWDEAQEDYRCLSMNGMMCVPSVIKNPAMVGQVLELLGYYTAPVKVAFYEDLLGSKMSEAPDDARMLELIWDHQVFENALISYEKAGLSDAFYLMAHQVSAGQNTLSSKLKSLEKQVNNSLKAFYK
jgi:ABC-type glycerol-3-phosphate transport system substrate-binding protein